MIVYVVVFHRRAGAFWKKYFEAGSRNLTTKITFGVEDDEVFTVEISAIVEK